MRIKRLAIVQALFLYIVCLYGLKLRKKLKFEIKNIYDSMNIHT